MPFEKPNIPKVEIDFTQPPTQAWIDDIVARTDEAIKQQELQKQRNKNFAYQHEAMFPEFSQPNEYGITKHGMTTRQENEELIMVNTHYQEYAEQYLAIQREIKKLKTKLKNYEKDCKAMGINVGKAKKALNYMIKEEKMSEVEKNERNVLMKMFGGGKVAKMIAEYVALDSELNAPEVREEDKKWAHETHQLIDQQHHREKRQREEAAGMEWLDFENERLRKLVSQGWDNHIPLLEENERQIKIRDERREQGLPKLPEHDQPAYPDQWLERRKAQNEKDMQDFDNRKMQTALNEMQAEGWEVKKENLENPKPFKKPRPKDFQETLDFLGINEDQYDEIQKIREEIADLQQDDIERFSKGEISNDEMLKKAKAVRDLIIEKYPHYEKILFPEEFGKFDVVEVVEDSESGPVSDEEFAVMSWEDRIKAAMDERLNQKQLDIAMQPRYLDERLPESERCQLLIAEELKYYPGLFEMREVEKMGFKKLRKFIQEREKEYLEKLELGEVTSPEMIGPTRKRPAQHREYLTRAIPDYSPDYPEMFWGLAKIEGKEGFLEDEAGEVYDTNNLTEEQLDWLTDRIGWMRKSREFHEKLAREEAEEKAKLEEEKRQEHLKRIEQIGIPDGL